MATPSSGWYNDAEYSDLTLRLNDGREVKVHKLVICKQSEYFRKLCGAASSFKVRSHLSTMRPKVTNSALCRRLSRA